MANTKDKVIDIALSQVGYCEKSAAAVKKDPTVLYRMTDGAGVDNYTKYGKEMHDLYPSVMDYPAAWCDCFVDACFYQAYGTTNAKGLLGGDFNDYTPASAQLYKNKGAWHTEPETGDQIFFTNGTRICHTGLVYKVDSNYVYTVEGNTSAGNAVIANGGAVCKKSYRLDNPKIAGYGRPNYDVEYDTGWHKDAVGWKYYDGGFYKNCWKLINHHWYYFGSDGYMLTGPKLINDELYFLCETGDYEGACMKTDETGALTEWYVD